MLQQCTFFVAFKQKLTLCFNHNDFYIHFIVPTIPSGNIHAPVVMVAEKGADLIKELWLQEEVLLAEQAAASSVNVYANATAA